MDALATHVRCDYAGPTEGCAKSALNTYCQRIVRRPLAKDAIEYKMICLGMYQQAFVQVGCVEEAKLFAGELCDNEKAAAQSAAEKALEYYMDAFGAFTDTERLKWRDADFRSNPQEAAQGDPTSQKLLPPKVALNSLCMRVARRPLAKGDTVYTAA